MSQLTPSQPNIDILVSKHQPENATLKSYIIGFSGSIVLTMTAYLMVRYSHLNQPIMIAILSLLAIIQFIVQLIYFLHIKREFSPRLRLIVLVFMITIVFILVSGSIWIMNNLTSRMMSPKNMVQYMNNQDNL